VKKREDRIQKPERKNRNVITSDRRERGNLGNYEIASVVLLPRNHKKLRILNYGFMSLVLTF